MLKKYNFIFKSKKIYNKDLLNLFLFFFFFVSNDIKKNQF